MASPGRFKLRVRGKAGVLCERLCIATGQYSSFCGCAGVIWLDGSDHMEDDDQDRGDVGHGQKVETHEREEEVKSEERQRTIRHMMTSG